MKANEYIKENGLEEACQLLEMGRGFVKLSDDGGFHTDDLKRLVESHEIVEKLGGLERAKLNLISTDRHLGYTHVYLHGNGYYCFLDDRVDYIIPERAIDIKLAIKAIADVEACQ